jgi:HSP20 family protein
MALTKREGPRALDVFDRFFGHWPEMIRRPIMVWPEAMEDMLRVEEYRENGDLVIRAEMPGIDPDKDVELTVTDGMLHIGAERREEKKAEDKDYYRHELRYGSFSRDLPLPEGCKESDVKAAYKDGILEIRVPVPKAETKKPAAKKIPVTKG